MTFWIIQRYFAQGIGNLHLNVDTTVHMKYSFSVIHAKKNTHVGAVPPYQPTKNMHFLYIGVGENSCVYTLTSVVRVLRNSPMKMNTLKYI